MPRRFGLSAFSSLTLAIAVGSCGGGGGDGGGASNTPTGLNVLSPSNSAVLTTSTVTVRVQGSDWEELWVESSPLQPSVPGTQPVRTDAHAFGTDSFASGVPVWSGTTRLLISGRRSGGQLASKLIQVSQPAQPVEGVRLSVSPSTVHNTATPVQIEATYTGIGVPQQAWLDADGDGTLDAQVGTTGPIPWTYSSEGYFTPRLVVRLASGVYHDSFGQAVTVTVASPPSLVDTAGQFDLPAAARDVADDRVHRQVLVLTSDSRLHVFDEAGVLVASHTLQQVQDLVGIDVDPNGDVYAVDRGLNQLRKFSRASAYTPDASFGTGGVVGALGANNGQFNQPRDVQCLPSVDGVHLWVADSGNQRLQRFSGSGAFQLALATGPDIAQPVTMVADFAGHVTTVDAADGDLAVFELNGTRIAYVQQLLGVDPALPPRASADANLGVLLSDPVNDRLLCFDRDGAQRMSIATAPDAPLAAVHVVGRRVVVAVAGASRLAQIEWTDPAGESPVEVVTRFFTAINQNADATALALLASETESELTALLADPVKGPVYRDLAGRVGSASELSRSERQAAVHGLVDPGTPQAQPIVIELRRDVASNRWLVLGL